jgi:hypothetical protein
VYFTVSSPAATPVITPVAEMVALPVVMLHVPPDTVEVTVDVAATHTEDGPEIAPADGSGLTVIARITKQPVGKV